jgi:disulfide oxidoreductase YuzD
VIKFGRPPAPTAEEFAEWKRRELRDRFAGQALVGYIAIYANRNPPAPDSTANYAYRVADAMLAEREK